MPCLLVTIPFEPFFQIDLINKVSIFLSFSYFTNTELSIFFIFTVIKTINYIFKTFVTILTMSGIIYLIG